MTSNSDSSQHHGYVRYLQLLVLVLAGGAIYPLLYLRQNFEVSMLEAFSINNVQLGQCYSVLGVMFFLTYLPSGWLADKFTPRSLITSSLAATGLLGAWYWTLPSFFEMQVIFAGWGITTGLTFWAALIKETTLLAGHDHQARFFGILEGGRGIVEAVLASIAVAAFAWALSAPDASTAGALQQVILIYVAILFVIAVVNWFALGDLDHGEGSIDETHHTDNLADIKLIFGKVEVWLASICILCGYALFYSTYSFAGFLQTELAMSAVVVGWITVGRLWMRPIGGILAGFIGDRFEVERVLSVVLLLCGVGLAWVVFLPKGGSVALILAVVLAVSLFTYAVRGIYWGTLDSCNVSSKTKGLAIGVISLIGYSPEIWVPLLNGYLVDAYPGRPGYALFFGSIAVLGVAGSVAAYALMRISRPKTDQPDTVAA